MEATTNVAAATGNLFRYAAAAASTSTTGRPKHARRAPAQMHVDLGDGASHAVTISLK